MKALRAKTNGRLILVLVGIAAILAWMGTDGVSLADALAAF